MPGSALVAYATKNGSTAEIAAALADELRAAGLSAALCDVDQVHGLEQYDTVVLGSAVYMGRWRRRARRFLKRNRRTLSEADVWIFSSGPVGEQKPGAERWTVPKLVTKMAPRIGAHEHVVFGGRVPTEPKNFMERAMARDTPEHLRDLRDWDEIRAWARKIAEVSGQAAGPVSDQADSSAASSS